MLNLTEPHLFLEGESESQFLGVGDFKVFAGVVVEKFQIAAKYQKRHRKNCFSRSIQWCNPHLAVMLWSPDI